jgi:ribosomal protein L11 methyltransferase
MLWKISVATTPEAEDAVTELLEATLQTAAASYTDLETGLTTVQAFPVTILSRARTRLTLGLERIKACGVSIGPAAISISRLRTEDWAESWKRHFKPIEIGAALLIKPSWSKRRPKKSQSLMVLDPGLSFGTGQHPTTAFCLHQLVRHRTPGLPQPFLDIGTGSGILAIAAARVGYAPVEAFDSDRDSVAIARINARQNNVHRQVRIILQDLSKLSRNCPQPYAFVCANLISTLLLQERDRIVARVAPNGVLVLAGVLRSEFRQVEQTYETGGLRLIARRTENEWTSAAFRKGLSGMHAPIISIVSGYTARRAGRRALRGRV